MDYQASHGNLGYLTTIVAHRLVPGEDHELPRADVQIRFEARVLILFHWVEEKTGGLAECVCACVHPRLPPVDEVPSPPADLVARWLSEEGAERLDGVHLLCAAANNHPTRTHFLLHASSAAAAEQARALVDAEAPALAALMYEVR